MQTKLLSLLLMLVSLSITAQETSHEPSPNFEVKNRQPSYKLLNNRYFSVQFMGFTFHPGGGAVNMVKNYPLKMDKKAYIVFNVGAVANYDYELSRKFFLRSSAGLYMDCAYQKAGFVHLGIRFKGITLGRHSFNGGVGPVLSVREDWHKFDGYNDKDFYGNRVWNGMQYRFFPLGGELEYQYQINEQLAFQYSVIPGYPAVITSKFGLRFKLN
jgi:hypothetical protein